MRNAALAVALGLAFASPGLAQQAADRPSGLPSGEDPDSPAAEAPTVWAASNGERDRGDTARADDARDAARSGRSRCGRKADPDPHGHVWAEVGTGGYRSAGAVVTQPLGDCGSLTVGVSKTEGRVYGRR